MMMSIVVIAIMYFIIGIFAREILNTAVKEWKLETERIKKANDFYGVKGE